MNDLDGIPRAFFDVCIGKDAPRRRITIKLFNDIAPKAVQNFLILCRGEKGSVNLKNPNRTISLSYNGCCFHRVVEGFMIQSGDITTGDGRGGMCVLDEPRDSEYLGDPAEEKTFEDESLDLLPVNEAGLVCMANRGPNTNTSQFFITLDDCSFLNGKHTVFGKVETGMDFVQDIGRVKVGENDKPIEDVVIVACGQYWPESPKQSNDGDGDEGEDIQREQDTSSHLVRAGSAPGRSETAVSGGDFGGGGGGGGGSNSARPTDADDRGRSTKSSRSPGSRRERPLRPRSRSHSRRRHHRHHDHHHHRRRSRSPRRHYSRSRSPRRNRHHRDDDEYMCDDPYAEERILREEREREGNRWDNMPHTSTEPKVKFKGRGTMRYRERKQWGGPGESYGRLN